MHARLLQQRRRRWRRRHPVTPRRAVCGRLLHLPPPAEGAARQRCPRRLGSREMTATTLATRDLTPRIATEVRADKEGLLSGVHAGAIRELLEQGGVLVF